MTDEQYMELAIEEARKAKAEGDWPFGAIVVREGEVISMAHAQDHILHDVTAHAELQAVKRACDVLKRTELNDCVIYCSNEPCLMCAAAIFQAKIPRVLIGASRDDLPQLLRPRKLRIDHLAEDTGHKPKIVRGILKDKVLELFKDIKK